MIHILLNYTLANRLLFDFSDALPLLAYYFQLFIRPSFYTPRAIFHYNLFHYYIIEFTSQSSPKVID